MPNTRLIEAIAALREQYDRLHAPAADSDERARELLRQGHLVEAEQVCRDGVERDPDRVSTWLLWGEILRSQTNIAPPPDPDTCLRVARDLSRLGHHPEAEDVLRCVINSGVAGPDVYCELVREYQRTGRAAEAIAQAEQASRKSPDDFFLSHISRLILPIVYQRDEELRSCREQFARALNDIVHNATTEGTALGEMVRATGRITNFYLAYQGENDLELQRAYGNFLSRVMGKAYPQYGWPTLAGFARVGTQPIQPRSRKNGERIRVGYVSSNFRHHSVANTTRGWLAHADHRRFEVHTFYVDPRPDYLTADFRQFSDHYHELPPDISACAEAIATAALDVLVYPDIGMYPLISQLAALRLAPVQCTSWGHPVTSGFPTIDYYLSGGLMEPEDASEHYSETLIRLPNTGVAYATPALPAETLPRSYFGIPDHAVAYLCCQSVYKYLPRHDHLYADIAVQVPSSYFIWLLSGTAHVDSIFRERIESAFESAGADARRCIFLPPQDYLEYLNLIRVSDVFLDTPEWSGANTAYEAIPFGLPIVTLPGRFMRGRHCYALLRMMGISETIAGNERQYIEIAGRLGNDAGFRGRVRDKVLAAQSRVYDDLSTVEALENFYQRVTGPART